MGVLNRETDRLLKPETIYKCISRAAATIPEAPAVIELDKAGNENAVTWRQLCRYTDALAAHLSSLGVSEASRVCVAMPNSIAAVAASLAVWRLGACAFMLSWQLVPDERRGLLDQIKPALVLTAWGDGRYPELNVTDGLIRAVAPAGRELPDLISKPGRATATGGSTGVPKIILDEAAFLFGEEDFAQWSRVTGQSAGQVQLVCGSLHHSLFNNSFYMAMAMGCTNVLLRHFDEKLVLKAIEKYRVNSMVLVPTMMSRIIRCPDFDAADISSVKTVHHAGAACPAWLKKEWIQRFGAETIHEFYSMSEKVGMTHIRGDEWLMHQGSVGKAVGADIVILDDDGKPVPAGTVGSVYFVPSTPATVHYLLQSQRLNEISGAVSVGDIGSVDEEGYLYLVDRRSDMIISGGKNVYAAEVENVLREYSAVRDIVVIGLSDPVWGRRVHAVVEPSCRQEDFDVYAFADFAFRRMSSYKLPKTMELVPALPRDDSGKLRRGAMVEEREKGGVEYIKIPNGRQIYAWRAKKTKK